MKNDEAKAPSKPEWQRYCHACAHPLAEGLKTCPECDTLAVDVDELLELARRNESPESRRARLRKEMALIFDMYCSAFIFLVLLCSMGLLIRMQQLVDYDKMTESGLDYWFLGYFVLVLFAMVALIRIDRVNLRYHLDRLKK